MEASGREDSSNSRDESTRKTAADLLREKKTKLKKDIQELEELNFLIECNLNISKFGDIKHLLKFPELASDQSSKRIPDVEMEYKNELFQFTGMYCTKIVGNEYVFSFVQSGKFISKTTYAVQITDVLERPKVGKWVMPISIDMNDIIEETPLQNTTDLKAFLANCKYHIDCYTNRVQQYDELQSILNNRSGCWLDCNLGKTVITLRFHDMQVLETEELHQIILYLIYESNRVRPHKIKIDSFNSETLPQALVNKFKSYFKHFKYSHLGKAFEETIGAEDTPVIWTRGQNEDIPDLQDSDEFSSEPNFVTNTRRSKARSKQRGRKRKIAETSLHSQGSSNEEQSADDSDSQRNDAPHSRLVDSINRGAEESLNNKGNRRVRKVKKTEGKRKRIAAGAASTAARALKKKSKPTNSTKNNVGASANVSKTTLRQSTLGFEVQRTKETVSAQLNEDVPLSEKISPAATSIMKQKSKSNVTVLGNHAFGTSTPVVNITRQKKRFLGFLNTTEVSPIKSKDKTGDK